MNEYEELLEAQANLIDHVMQVNRKATDLVKWHNVPKEDSADALYNEFAAKADELEASKEIIKRLTEDVKELRAGRNDFRLKAERDVKEEVQSLKDQISIISGSFRSAESKIAALNGVIKDRDESVRIFDESNRELRKTERKQAAKIKRLEKKLDQLK